MSFYGIMILVVAVVAGLALIAMAPGLGLVAALFVFAVGIWAALRVGAAATSGDSKDAGPGRKRRPPVA